MTAKDVEAWLDDLRKTAKRRECWSCDCHQGFLVQLQMDADAAAAELIQPLIVSSARLHGCLGCDPCPPGAAFADYLSRMNQRAPCCTKECADQDHEERKCNE